MSAYQIEGSPEDENSVFSNRCVIYFIWCDDGNSPKPCRWCCANSGNLQTTCTKNM